MAVERIHITSRAEWLALRKRDVTASRIGALFSCHPYVTALRVYCEHAGVEFPEQEETAVMRRGRLLEGAVALAVADERPEWRTSKNEYYYRDPHFRLGATPDFLIDGDPRGLGVLQTKTAAPSVFERDWHNGTEIPFWITLQTLVEMMLTDAAFGVVAVMQVDAFDLKCSILDVPRDARSEQRIKQAVSDFWLAVAEGREPAPNYGRDAELIRLLAPREVKDKLVDLSGDNELPMILAERERLMKEIAENEKRKDEIEAEVRHKMGDGERSAGLPDGWSITWKTHHRAEQIIAAKDIRALRIFHKQLKDAA
jgi:predicted phage-related endonuclease